MENNLDFSLCYTPSIKTDTSINYVCSDRKIHVRFRDYTKEQVISGFEKKLTYLITYLINFSSTNKLFGICSTKIIIDNLSESEDIKTLYNCLKYEKQIDFKCFRFTPNYKKTDCHDFGELDLGAFPLNYDSNGVLLEGSLNAFLSNLKISLLDYLFNDAYSIMIHKKINKEVNKKFIDKENRKSVSSSTDFIKLW